MKKIIFLFIFIYSSIINASSINTNFDKADLTTVIKSISQITGKQFIIDPRVKGRVTLSFPKSISNDDLFQTLLSVLNVHGYTVVPNGNINKVIPINLAKSLSSSKTYIKDSWSTQVFNINYVSVNQLYKVIKPMLSQYGEVIPLIDSKKIIVTDNNSNMHRLLSVINKVDVNTNNHSEIVSIKYQPAQDIFNTLKSLYGKDSKSKLFPFSYNSLTNTILLVGDAQTRLFLRSTIANLDLPPFSLQKTIAYSFQYLTINDISDYLSDFNDLTIKSLPLTNQLLISGNLNQVNNLLNLLKSIDKPIKQLLIQSIFIEVNSDFSKQLGLDLSISNGNINSLLNLTGLTNQFSSVSQIGANISLTDSQKWGLFLKALKTNTNVNILSTPSVIALNNHESNIVIGREVPFQTGTFSNANAEGTNIVRKNVGLKLTVTPHINSNNNIRLSIDNEISDVLPKGEAVDIQTTKRSITTQAILNNNQILAIGGLFSNRSSAINSSIPGLSYIPIIGSAFSNTSTSNQKTNLLVFIKPSLITPNTTTNIIKSSSSISSIKTSNSIKPNQTVPTDDILDLDY